VKRFLLNGSKRRASNAFAHLRHRKAFTLPKGKVANDDLAFGRVTADIYFAETSQNKAEGWLPKTKPATTTSPITKRLCSLSIDETYELAERIWKFLIENAFSLHRQRIRI
jgi:hypothetical protein